MASLSLALALLAACGGASPSGGAAPAPTQGQTQTQTPSLTKITIAAPTALLSFAPIYIAQAKGYYRSAGLDVKLLAGGGTPQVLAAVLSGDAQFAIGSGQNLFELLAKGKDAVAVQALNIGLTQAVVMSDQFLQKTKLPAGATDDQKIATLVGRRFGALSVGGPDEVVLRYMMILGGHKASDITVVKTASTGAKLSSMKTGVIDGTNGSPPVPQLAEKQGIGQAFIDLGKLPVYSDTVWEALYVLRPYLRSHADVIGKLVKANAEAIDFMRANPAAAAQLLVPDFSGLDAATLEAGLSSIMGDFKDRGAMSRQAWEDTAKPLAAMAQMTHFKAPPSYAPDTFWTNKFVSGQG